MEKTRELDQVPVIYNVWMESIFGTCDSLCEVENPQDMIVIVGKVILTHVCRNEAFYLRKQLATVSFDSLVQVETKGDSEMIRGTIDEVASCDRIDRLPRL